MNETKGYAFKHYQMPVTIFWNDPKEYFVKGMKTLLRDIEENGIERWTVKELKAEIKDIPPVKGDECCPPSAPSPVKRNAVIKFEV